jgi:hypothetical protein
MGNTQRRWYLVLGPVVGVLVMLTALAILVFRHDDVSGYSFLGVGAAIFGISGVGSRRGHKSDVAN